MALGTGGEPVALNTQHPLARTFSQVRQCSLCEFCGQRAEIGYLHPPWRLRRSCLLPWLGCSSPERTKQRSRQVPHTAAWKALPSRPSSLPPSLPRRVCLSAAVRPLRRAPHPPMAPLQEGWPSCHRHSTCHTLPPLPSPAPPQSLPPGGEDPGPSPNRQPGCRGRPLQPVLLCLQVFPE